MSTRLKIEEDVTFVDYKLLKKEIANLETTKKNIIGNINLENKKLSDLIEEEIKIKASNDKLISDTKVEAKNILTKAKEREGKVVGLEAEVKGKIAEAEEAKRQADNLIKSNRGKEKSLIAEKETVAGLKAKLTKIMGMIKDVV